MNVILADSRLQMPPNLSSDIVAEANHRIANSLTLLVSMVRMQAASVRKNPATLSNAEVPAVAGWHCRPHQHHQPACTGCCRMSGPMARPIFART